MRYRIIFALAFIGVLAGCVAAYVFDIEKPPQPPVFSTASNPYTQGIYAEGIVESDQPTGENINVYPEVAGTVKQVFVSEGQAVKKGTVLMLIDDSIQTATVGQLHSQSQAAFALLEELKAQPRKETLQVAASQVKSAQATLKTSQDELEKQRAAFDLNPKSISKDSLDSATNAVEVARANLEVSQKQYELTQAGAWIYDINNQERQYNALLSSYEAASALLSKYTLRAPKEGVVLSISPTAGSFVSPQGAYETYTQGMSPVLVLGSAPTHLNVRCYVDEILVPRLPPPARIKAQMSIRGSNVKVSLSYVRMQPLISPKIELSDQRTERVDVRVLPIIFRIETSADLKIYPGQLVDVYIEQ